MAASQASTSAAAAALSRALGHAPSAVAGLLPSADRVALAARYLLCALLLVNVRSLPLGWHIRIFRPVVRLRLRYLLLQLRILFKSRRAKELAIERWFDGIMPIGANPLEYVTTYRSWASVDDSDFNLHLSNSSYAKTLDSARLKMAMEWVPQFFRVGGWLPLAGTHYSFIREIPMFASYEVRVSVAAWDDKWLYIVSKFVTKPKRKSRAAKSHTPSAPGTPNATAVFHPSFRTANESAPPSAPTTPSAADMAGAPTDAAARALTAVTAGLLRAAEPDGATLHTLSVAQICFKHGRITVPPAVVLAVNGWAAPPADGARAYGAANPPPHWAHVRRLVAPSAGGSLKKMVAFLRGGWRDVPEGERWWEDALGGALDERRRANLAALNEVRYGMEGARAL